MKTATVIIAGKALGKVVNHAVKYLKDEASGHYALLEPADVCVSGEGAGGVNWSNHVLQIVSIDDDNVRFRAEPFAASTGYWNGPSVVADFDDGRIEASLFHDLIWTWADEIAEANGMSETELLTWSNLHLAIMWREYGRRHGCKALAVRAKSWLAAQLCDSWLAKVWRKLTVLVLLATMLGGCAGCLQIPDWTVTDAGEVVYEQPESK
jgi:hypothetical protein